MTDAQLRSLYAQVLARREPSQREGCASPDELLALVEGGVDSAERLRVLRHVGGCDECRGELELLRAAAEAGRRLGRRWTPAFAVAASITLVLGAALVWRSLTPVVTRGGLEQIALVAPRGAIEGNQEFRLVWRKAGAALQYDVELVDGGGTPVWAVSTRDTAVSIPDTVRLAPGVEYWWWVSALLSSGGRPRSPIARFTVLGP